MPTLRQRSEVLTSPHPHPRGNEIITSQYDATWYSNRENGQIVKRESPFNLLAGKYTRLKGHTLVANIAQNAVYDSVVNWNGLSSQCYGRAYGKFKRQMDIPTAEMLLNVVEGRKSLEMIAARGYQLAGLIRGLRRGRLGDAFTYMTLNPNASLLQVKNGRRRDSRFVSGKARQDSVDAARRSRQLVRDIGTVILEIRYGWMPLLQDMQNAIDVLCKPVPDKEVVAKMGSSGSFSYEIYPYGPVLVHTSEHCTIKGKVRVTDPKLNLANRLGLLNVPSVAWDAMPFSFVVDWFLPVGPWLQSLTDFVGLELIDGSITLKRTHFCSDYPGSVWSSGSEPYVVGGDRSAASVHAKKLTRTVGITSLPHPPLVLGRGLTPGRAINAVALVTQLLDPRKGAKIRGGDL
jgi:hypothetical protein